MIRARVRRLLAWLDATPGGSGWLALGICAAWAAFAVAVFIAEGWAR